MIYVTLHDGQYCVHAHARDTTKMRRIPGARHNRRLDAWIVPGNIGGYAALGAALGKDNLTFDDNVAAHNQRLKDWMQQAEDRQMGEFAPLQDARLYDYQQSGASALSFASTALCDDMGTGKTIQALRSLPATGRVLVVAPNSVKGSWANETRIWTDRTPYVLGGGVTPKNKRIALDEIAADESALVIVNYESLASLSALKPFGSAQVTKKQAERKPLNDYTWTVMIADEAHKLKDPTSQQTRAANYLRQQTIKAHALTGTPIVNDADDLWSIMHFVAPAEWPSRSRYRELYCYCTPGWHGGIENHGVRPEMLPYLDLLLQPRMLRRTKDEVLPFLPEKQHTTITLPLTKEQRKMYREMEKQGVAFTDEGGILVGADPLTKLQRMREVASAVPITNDDYGIVALDRPSNKLDWILDAMQSLDCLVIYAESAKLIKFLARSLRDEGYRVGEIHEAIVPEQRTDWVADFQAGDLDIMCITTGAGAEGITLTRASTLVFAQRSWSNVANRQSEDRIHRIGQDRGTNIITLESEDTVDEHVTRVAADKEVNMQKIVRDPQFWKDIS